MQNGEQKPNRSINHIPDMTSLLWADRIRRVLLIFFLIMLPVLYHVYNRQFDTSVAGILKWFALLVLEILRWGLYAICIFYTFIVLRTWYATIKLIGFPSLAKFRRMCELNGRRPIKKHGGYARSVIAFILGLIFVFIWKTTDIDYFLCLVIFWLSLAVSMFVADGMPPIVLLLSTSHTDIFFLKHKIEVVVHPLGVASLLNVATMDKSRSYSKPLRRSGADPFDFRKENDDIWEETVHELFNFAPIVVIDTRHESSALFSEAKWLICPARAYKVLFLVGENGECPLLEAILPQASVSDRCDIKLVKSEEELLRSLQYMVESPSRLPKPCDNKHSVLDL